MKRIACVISCVFLIFACLTACACEKRNTAFFIFLSVRMRGNGDGTLSAVAQNEFTIGNPLLPVTLTIYRGESSSPEDMVEVKSMSCEDLLPLRKITLDADAEAGYYLATVTYEVNGEEHKLLSDVVRYDSSGKRN